MNIETVKLSEKYGIEGNATLKCFVHDRDEEMKRYNVDLPAMIVCPGGGYCFTSRREADPIAVEFYNRKYATFVLNYDVAPYRYPVALTELAAAVDYVRSNAEKFSVNPNRIFVVGFSAGGHLACSTGIVYDEVAADNGDECDAVSARPDAMILCYPVITCQEGKAHFGSFECLLGGNDRAAFAPCSWETRVTASTPPAFLWHTSEDSAVPVENSLEFALAMRRQKLPFELHVFPYGHHGLGLGTKEEYAEVRRWPELAGTWLEKMGF